MKRFILSVLLFLIPVAAVLAGWEMVMRNFPHPHQVRKDIILEKCRKDGEILFLGSSHAYFGVNTDMLPNAYNLAYVSQNFLQDRFIFEQLISKPHKLKYVALPVSLFSFFRYISDDEEWRLRDYVRYWNYPAKSFTDKFFILDNVPLQVVYVRKNFGKIKKRGIHKVFHITETGWGTAYAQAGNAADFKQLGAAAAQRHSGVDMNDTSNADALKDIIKLAQQHKIKVILYTPPAHETYYNSINARQEQKMRAIIAEAAAEKDVYYLDLLRSPEFKNEDFADPDHMSHKGAEKLVKKLHEFYRNK